MAGKNLNGRGQGVIKENRGGKLNAPKIKMPPINAPFETPYYIRV